MFNAKSLTEARNRKDEILANYSDVAESAMTCLEEGFDGAMTVLNYLYTLEDITAHPIT